MAFFGGGRGDVDEVRDFYFVAWQVLFGREFVPGGWREYWNECWHCEGVVYWRVRDWLP